MVFYPRGGPQALGDSSPVVKVTWGLATTRQIMWFKYLAHDFVGESFKRHFMILFLIFSKNAVRLYSKLHFISLCPVSKTLGSFPVP